MRAGSSRLALPVLAALAAALLPAPVLACAVCFVGSGRTMTAFYGTAILLTVLPLVLIGGIGFWLRRRLRARTDLDASSEVSLDTPR